MRNMTVTKRNMTETRNIRFVIARSATTKQSRKKTPKHWIASQATNDKFIQYVDIQYIRIDPHDDVS